MSLPTLSTALQAALTSANLRGIDLLVFDACLMANFAVAASLAHVSGYLVASETNEYGGFQYTVRAWSSGGGKMRMCVRSEVLIPISRFLMIL